MNSVLIATVTGRIPRIESFDLYHQGINRTNLRAFLFSFNEIAPFGFLCFFLAHLSPTCLLVERLFKRRERLPSQLCNEPHYRTFIVSFQNPAVRVDMSERTR